MKTTKLLQIQQLLKAPKNQRNNFGNYNYRSCEDILEAVKPILDSVGATLSISDDIVAIGDRIYVKATATLKDSDTGEMIEQTTAFARESETKKGMDDSQITGASSSYARKYALNGLFLIDDTKDADATNTHGKDITEENPFSKKNVKEIKKTEKADADSGEWYDKALTNTKFMLNCLDEDDFINKLKARLTELGVNMNEGQEKSLRTAYQNQKTIEKMGLNTEFLS